MQQIPPLPFPYVLAVALVSFLAGVAWLWAFRRERAYRWPVDPPAPDPPRSVAEIYLRDERWPGHWN